jgi:cell division cycle 20-like protein 1 (cofactor of APC complex)
LDIIFNSALHLQGNLVAVGTRSGHVQAWDVAVSKQINEVHDHSGRVGALAWNGDVVSSGSRDTLILQRDMRAPSTAVTRRLKGHMKEVSKNDL